jgi:hypothetical protein
VRRIFPQYGLLWQAEQGLPTLSGQKNQGKVAFFPRHLPSTLILHVLQCDLIDPACSQCLRAGKDCPGYRDQLSLLFRDESEKVVRKAKIPRKGPLEHCNIFPGQATSNCGPDLSAPPSPVPSVIARRRSSQALVAHTCGAPPRPLSPYSVDEGVILFFDHYMTINSNYPPWMERLPGSPIGPSIFGNHSLTNAVSAVGYAGLANVTKNPEHMIVARRKYAASISFLLRTITLALKDTSSADLDALFRSVLLLAAFEVSLSKNVTHHSADYLQVVNGGSGSWGAHLDGGAAILKLIPAKQPRRVPAMRMQIQFVFSGASSIHIYMGTTRSF